MSEESSVSFEHEGQVTLVRVTSPDALEAANVAKFGEDTLEYVLDQALLEREQRPPEGLFEPAVNCLGKSKSFCHRRSVQPSACEIDTCASPIRQ